MWSCSSGYICSRCSRSIDQTLAQGGVLRCCSTAPPSRITRGRVRGWCAQNPESVSEKGHGGRLTSVAAAAIGIRASEVSTRCSKSPRDDGS